MLAPALGNAHRDAPVAAGILPRNETEPGGHMPTVLELSTIADSCDDRRSDLGTDALDRSDTLAGRISFEYGIDLVV